jgi:AcrR family transcriptional regulator
MIEHAETQRGRPLGFNPDAALDELMYLFWDKGYDHTTQADMVERTGLSSSSLYNSFGGKAAIFDAVLARYNEGVDANCAPMFDRADGLEALEVFIDRLGQHVKEPLFGSSGCLVVTTMSEAGGEAEAVDARINYYRTHIEEAMAASLDRAEKSGTIFPGNAGERAAILFAMYIGAQATARVDPDSASAMVQGMKSVLTTWKRA